MSSSGYDKALTRLGDTGPIVALTQALVRAWPAGRDLEYVHLPLAAGERPPVLDPGFYRPLGGLRALPESLRLIAGLVHEEQDLAEQVLVLRTVEQCLGRTVGVSPACGLGRRTPEAAERAVERALALARS
ncbi:MAG: hypothetical protein JWO67_3661 [Streptosporangiaceae bacterium]|jgi:hypothetical protein|nr:hypothetical protein [Streptosporangiaceae bacterium]